jgi:YegS/Rv2252/BmrU family lipid kinase
MKHLFIINPTAGKKGSTDALVAWIKALFGARRLSYEIAFTSAQGDAERITRQAAERGEPLRIYACGGDGTLNEVVNGAAGHDFMAVTNYPKGTGNDFLKIFGKRYRERFSDLEALAEGPQVTFDLMECNGKLGIGSICAGLDARVAADVHKYKGLPLVNGIGAYILSLLVNVLFNGISRPADVEIGGTITEGELTILCVMNGRYYGGGFMPVGDSEPDDGVLDMLVVPRVSLLTLLRVIGPYAKGRYWRYPELIKDYHGTEISLSSAEGLVAVVDGEVMWDSRFTIRLSEHKINFFYPGDLSYRAER